MVVRWAPEVAASALHPARGELRVELSVSCFPFERRLSGKTSVRVWSTAGIRRSLRHTKKAQLGQVISEFIVRQPSGSQGLPAENDAGGVVTCFAKGHLPHFPVP